jgi:hypothetical protein
VILLLEEVNAIDTTNDLLLSMRNRFAEILRKMKRNLYDHKQEKPFQAKRVRFDMSDHNYTYTEKFMYSTSDSLRSDATYRDGDIKDSDRRFAFDLKSEIKETNKIEDTNNLKEKSNQIGNSSNSHDNGRTKYYPSVIKANGGDDLNELKDQSVSVDNIDKGTLGEIFDTDIPEEYFTYKLPEWAQFNVEIDTWNSLLAEKNVDSRQLPKGKWAKMITDGIAKSNPYCVISFKSHTVANASRRRPRASRNLFAAHGMCTFNDCRVTVNVYMKTLPVMLVEYRGKLKHDIKEHHARYIRCGERSQYHQIFNCGKKPNSLFTELLQGKQARDGNLLVAGNMNSIGSTQSVLQKLSSECFQ